MTESFSVAGSEPLAELRPDAPRHVLVAGAAGNIGSYFAAHGLWWLLASSAEQNGAFFPHLHPSILISSEKVRLPSRIYQVASTAACTGHPQDHGAGEPPCVLAQALASARDRAVGGITPACVRARTRLCRAFGV